MALFDNPIAPDEVYSSMKYSRNPIEGVLFALVNPQERSVFNIPSEHDLDNVLALMESYTQSLTTLIAERATHLEKGDVAQADDASVTIKQREVSLASAIQLLRLKAYHDPLTHIHNRGAFDLALKQMVTNCCKGGSKPGKRADFGLICLDAVYFKALNEVFGETTGDEILRVIANSLRPEELKGMSTFEDKASRTGGDEFAILLSFHKVVKAKQAETLVHILERVSLITNQEIDTFISTKIAEGTTTRRELKFAIRKIYGNSQNLSPRIRLSGVLVNTSGFAHRYAVSDYKVSRLDHLDAKFLSTVELRSNTVDECCQEIVLLAKQAVDLVKRIEKTGRELPKTPAPI